MDRISVRAIEESLSWLKSADLNMKGQNYSKCVYDLHMALDIAVKAVLFAVEVDSPKRHNVNDLLEIAVSREAFLSKVFRSWMRGSSPNSFSINAIKHSFMYLSIPEAPASRNPSPRFLSVFYRNCFAISIILLNS